MNEFRLKNILKYWGDFIHLIFPETCLICENELIEKQQICTFCQTDLNYTYFESFTEPTILDKLFWGRINLESSYSMIYFEKSKSSQAILHALKYKNKPEIGIILGETIALKLMTNNKPTNFDALIPVPIHYKKKFIRGYNQSEKLAEGISKKLQIPIDNEFIERIVHSESQTKKDKFIRWTNVQNKFSLNKKGIKNYQHIAIIDDVITTGSTLEVIIKEIHKNYPDICVSVISLALAK